MTELSEARERLVRVADAQAEAARANQRIEVHEALCAERWRQSRAALEALRSDLVALSAKVSEATSRLYGRIWWIVGLLLAAQGAAILWLASKAFP